MATTIQISDTTKQLLEHLKKKEHLESYEQLLLHLLRLHTHVPKSMYGVSKGQKWNKKEDRATFDR